MKHLLFALSLFLVTAPLHGDEPATSPNSPWPEDFFDQKAAAEEEESLGYKLLLWIPNRFLDLVDVFKLDVGAGPTVGAVARVSKFAQVGLRSVSPMSVRVGLLGRRLPVMTETSSEIGASPMFEQSKDRIICPGEIGLGADLFIGAYGGICLDEAFDFLAGLVLIDLQDDDL